MKKPIEENPHITIREICDRGDVSIGTAERIVRGNLSLKKKIVTTWISHHLADEQQK